MDKYFFDKRRRKRNFLKYLCIFLVAFVPVVLFNIYVASGLKNWLVILLDSVILLGFALVGNVIANKYFEKKDAKLEAKIKLRKEMQERKEEILERSYKAKRNSKLEAKANKAKELEISGENNETNGKEDKWCTSFAT